MARGGRLQKRAKKVANHWVGEDVSICTCIYLREEGNFHQGGYLFPFKVPMKWKISINFYVLV